MLYLFVGKDTTFPRNFQGFWEKCRDDDKEKNRRLSEWESRLLNIYIYYDEVNLFVVYLLLGEDHLVCTLVREVELNLVSAFASRNIEVLTIIN